MYSTGGIHKCDVAQEESNSVMSICLVDFSTFFDVVATTELFSRTEERFSGLIGTAAAYSAELNVMRVYVR
jgi:hypothetical protein